MHIYAFGFHLVIALTWHPRTPRAARQSRFRGQRRREASCRTGGARFVSPIKMGSRLGEPGKAIFI